MSKRKSPKNWWKQVFGAIVGEAMFAGREAQSLKEVHEVLRQTGLRKGASILDLACGEGRHSRIFAKKGFNVTGLDYSQTYLATARKHAKKSRLKNLRYKHGDMRGIGQTLESSHFDLCVSLFNSFGYFDRRSDDLKMLKGVYKVLKPGGMFVLNTLNEGGVRQRLGAPVSLGREPEPNVFMIDQAEYDRRLRQTNCSWTIIDTRKTKAKVERIKFTQNVYSHEELKGLLRRVGFKVNKTWGVLGGGPFDPKISWHQTILSTKLE